MKHLARATERAGLAGISPEFHLEGEALVEDADHVAQLVHDEGMTRGVGGDAADVPERPRRRTGLAPGGHRAVLAHDERAKQHGAGEQEVALGVDVEARDLEVAPVFLWNL